MTFKQKITAELTKQIAAAIRAGAYPHVAAESFGVPKNVFDQWMEWGTTGKKRQPYKGFAEDIKQAQAQARLRAEMEVFSDDPKAWLKSGPGKEKHDEPGWTGIVKPILTGSTQNINVFTNPDFLKLMAIMRGVLAPYPDLLERIQKAIEQPDKPLEAIQFIETIK